MSEGGRKIELEIEEKCYLLVEEYSDYMDESEKNVLSRLINDSIKKYAEKYIELKKGYQEMAKINLEISHAFTESENEAFNRIDD